MKGNFVLFCFNFIKISPRWRMGCSTCIPAIYFIFVSRDSDKCYWPIKVLYTSPRGTMTMQTMTMQLCKEGQNAIWMGRFNLCHDNILMYVIVEEPLLALMALIKAFDRISMSYESSSNTTDGPVHNCDPYMDVSGTAMNSSVCFRIF